MRVDDDVYEQLHELLHAFKARTREAAAAELDALPPTAERALAFLSRHPDSTPSDMVEFSGRDKAQIARIIKQLEEAQLAIRTPDPSDGRSYKLALTERGRAVHKKLEAHKKRAVQAMLRGVSDDERAQLAALLRRLYDNLAR